MPESQPVSWRSIVYETPVISSDNAKVGQVREVLGDEAEDIFHGIRVALTSGHRDVMVSAEVVASMSTTDVQVNLTRSQVDALPTYTEEATYHVGTVGRFRKHLGWTKDSETDEER